MDEVERAEVYMLEHKLEDAISEAVACVVKERPANAADLLARGVCACSIDDILTL